MQVVDSRRLAGPPLMRLESEGGHAYLSMLLQLSASQTQKDQQAEVEGRLVTLALATLQRFQVCATSNHNQVCSALRADWLLVAMTPMWDAVTDLPAVYR